MNINLEYYRIFYYVSKQKGITAAAEKLCISQPAVSQGIKQLEKALGKTLFLRTSKGVELTPEGEVLYSYVKRGYELIQSGEEAFRKMLNLEHGEIKIGASDMTLQYYLLPHLERFHEAYPKIKVMVTNAPTPETLNYLAEGKIDFGVVSSPFDKNATLNVKKVKEIQDIFVAGSRFAHLGKDTLDYKQLEELPVICLEQNTSTRKYLDEHLLKNNVILKPEFELATSDMIVQFALRNLGIGCVVSNFAEKYIKEGALVPLQFSHSIKKRHFCVVTGKNTPISAAADKLLEMLISP